MSKKFSFRLEPILNLRSHRVKEAKEVFLQVQAMRINKENEILSNSNAKNSLYTHKQGSLSIADIQANFYRQKFLDAENERLENDKIRLLEIENHRRKLLAEAMKDEKVFQKLREKEGKIFRRNE